MTEIRAFQAQDLPQLTQLINLHIAMLIPTWSLPSGLILSHLTKNPAQYALDTWVIERKTLCAFVDEKLIASAHLLRYSTSNKLSETYRGRGDIAWFIFYPEHAAEAGDLLNACHEQMHLWDVLKLSAWDCGLSIPALLGISEKWPHISILFYATGYRAKPDRREALFAGSLEMILSLPKIAVKGRFLDFERNGLKELSLYLDGEIAFCKFDTHLPIKSLNQVAWAELSEFYVDPAWRGQGIGRALLQEMAIYLRLSGIKQIIFSVRYENEIADAGRFYRSLGWDVMSRSQDAWELADWRNAKPKDEL